MNQEHYDKLMEGVESWNKWREENPDIIPNLQGAKFYDEDLLKANLEGANLQEADLNDTQLYGTNLEGANLQGAYLLRVNLREANLSGANLQKAYIIGWLEGAVLVRANLQGANLSANLQEANLAEANLQGANLGAHGLILQGANLKGVNLQKVNFKVSYMTAGLCKVKTLYKAKFDLEIEKQVKEECPQLLEKPAMTPNELGLPVVISRLALLPEGLIVVTGPPGSGKSTTLAAIIQEANLTRRAHIITIEDPIEFIHKNKACTVDQREINKHTDSFETGLKNAMNQAADIILVSEMHDPQTMSLVMEAASNGYLVLTSMNTSSTYKTVNRIIESFPDHKQTEIRESLARCIKAIVTQLMLPRSDEGGYCPAFEILIGTPAARMLIMERREHNLMGVIQRGGKYGMQLMDDSLFDLIKKEMIRPEEAYEKALNKDLFKKYLSKPPEDFE